MVKEKAWFRIKDPSAGRDRWDRHSTKGGYILSSLSEERLGEKGGAFLTGKEGFCPPLGAPKGEVKTIEGRFLKKIKI